RSTKTQLTDTKKSITDLEKDLETVTASLIALEKTETPNFTAARYVSGGHREGKRQRSDKEIRQIATGKRDEWLRKHKKNLAKKRAEKADKEQKLKDLNELKVRLQDKFDSLVEKYPRIDLTGTWQRVFETTEANGFEKKHWSDKVTRLAYVINRNENFKLRQKDLADFKLEVKNGNLIISHAEKDEAHRKAKEYLSNFVLEKELINNLQNQEDKDFVRSCYIAEDLLALKKKIELLEQIDLDELKEPEKLEKLLELEELKEQETQREQQNKLSVNMILREELTNEDREKLQTILDNMEVKLVIDDWSKWKPNKTNLLLNDGTRANIGGLLNRFDIKDNTGAKDLGIAAAGLFQDIEGIDNAEVGQAKAGGDNNDILDSDGEKSFLDGGKGDDKLFGSVGDDALRGGEGEDHLSGGMGTDTILYDDSETGVYVDMDANVGKGGTAAGDTFTDIENVIGSAHNDKIIGNELDNTLYGGEGDDFLDGKTGDDRLEGGQGNDSLAGGKGADTIIGGDGNDAAVYSSSEEGVSVTLNRGDDNAAASKGDAEGDRIVDIENLAGSNHDDRLAGNKGDNTIQGGDGNDKIAGGDGDDKLIGGDGNDYLAGGDGKDQLVGGSGDDILIGDDGNDQFLAGSGSNRIYGGDGQDIAMFEGKISDYEFAFKNDSVVVRKQNGDALDYLSDVEFFNFDGQYFEVQSLIDNQDRINIIDDDGEIESVRRKNPNGSRKSKMSKWLSSAAALGIIAAAATPASSTEKMDYFSDDPAGTAGLGYPASTEKADAVLPVVDNNANLYDGSDDDNQYQAADSDTNVMSVQTDINGWQADNNSGDLEHNDNNINKIDNEYLYPDSTLADIDSNIQNSGSENAFTGSDNNALIEVPSDLEPGYVEFQAMYNAIEEEAIALKLFAVNPNPNSSMVVVLSGFPEGFTFSTGNVSGFASWTLVEEDLNGLIMYPREHSGDDFKLYVETLVTDVHGQTISSLDSMWIDIEAVADAPDLSVNDVTGLEDTAIALDFNAIYIDKDGSETSRFEIDGVPADAVLSSGYKDAVGIWHVTEAELSGLTLTPALHDDTDFDLTVSVFSIEKENNDEAAGSTETFHVNVQGVADAPGLTTSGTISMSEDEAVPIEINGSLVDADGSETLVYLIEGVPAGTVFYVDGTAVDAAREVEPGVWVIGSDETTNLDGSTKLTVRPPENSDTDFQLKVHAVTVDTAKDASDPEYSAAETVSLVTVQVNAVADEANLTVSDTSGDELQFIDLNLDVSLADTDGSETLHLTIEGLPDGSMLTNGVEIAPGFYALTPDQLEGLKFMAPKGTAATVALTVTAVSEEISTGESQTVTDTLNLTINAAPASPILSVSLAQGSEGGTVPIDISTNWTDLTPEQSQSIIISGVPEGAMLSNGTADDQVAGLWHLTPDDLTGLTMTLPEYSDTNFYLKVKALNTTNDRPDLAEVSPTTELPVIVDAK
ncbi:MAG: calcium-binding protein, partial [Planctomycetaceae bacterium]|nr:calcium-binding protein [Planctomycetaceae bacterium]